MGLAEALSKTELKNKVCSFQRMMDTLSKEDKEALQKALETNVTGRQIVLALRMEGHKVSPETLSNHRKNRCQCAANE